MGTLLPKRSHFHLAQALLLLYKETVQRRGLHLHSVDENYLPPWVVLSQSKGGKYLLMCNAGAATSVGFYKMMMFSKEAHYTCRLHCQPKAKLGSAYLLQECNGYEVHVQLNGS